MSSLPNRRQDNGRREKSLKLTLGLIAVLVVLVFAGAGIHQLGAGVATSVARPFWNIGTNVASIWQGFTVAFADKNKLILENQDLQLKLASANLLATQSEQLQKDNESLRASAGKILEQNKSTQLIARSLGAEHSGPFDVLTLDLGSANSQPEIKINDWITTLDHVWLGAVVQVTGATSRVRLLTLAGLTTPALLGEARVPVTLLGRGGGNFIATVPRGLSVAVGERAIVPSASQDWLVAIVGAVESEANKTEQTLYLRAPLDANSLKYVSILQKQDNN
ncbi:MAG: hypothetical protein AAB364_01575 [Patescibacteria group bacterium]